MRSRAILLFMALALGACSRAPDASVAHANEAVEADQATPQADAIELPKEVVPEGDPRIALAAKMPGTDPADLRATPVAGIYELAHDSEITYVTADGAYVFSGDLYKVTSDGEFPNLSDLRRREVRRDLMAAMPEQDMIVFGPKKAAHTISVFTDVDCQWCQKMHSQIADYNALGIRVRYMSYPRTGPNTSAWKKAEAVWCAGDRNDALTAATHGGEVASEACATPIARQYHMGQLMGLTGTPGVVFDTGELVPGYLSPKNMLQALQESEAGKPRAN